MSTEEQANGTGSEEASEEKKDQNTGSNVWRGRLIWVGVLLVVVLAMWGWRALGMRSLEKAHAEREARVVEHTRLVMDSIATEAREREVRLLAWAVRSELLRNNLEQVEQYLMAYVKEQGVQRVSLVAQDGSVQVSTDGKLLGSQMALAASVQGVVTSTKGDHLFLQVAVHGVEGVIGTLVVERAPFDGSVLLPPDGVSRLP